MKKKVTCRICGGESLYKYRVRGCRLSECTRCGFVQMTDSEADAPYDYGKSYFINNKYRDKTALEKEYGRRKKLLMKYVPARGHILDAGCATGDFVDYVSHTYYAVGYDVSADAIEIGRKRFPHTGRHLFEIKEFESRTATYDAVCMWDVIEHLSEPDKIAEWLRDKLKPRGYLLISTPNIGAPFARITKGKWPFMTPPEHISFFTKKAFRELADRLDMDMIEWKSRGKSANVGFILYKFNRVSNLKIPAPVIRLFEGPVLRKLHLYVPTGDIQYLVLRKRD